MLGIALLGIALLGVTLLRIALLLRVSLLRIALLGIALLLRIALLRITLLLRVSLLRITLLLRVSLLRITLLLRVSLLRITLLLRVSLLRITLLGIALLLRIPGPRRGSSAGLLLPLRERLSGLLRCRRGREEERAEAEQDAASCRAGSHPGGGRARWASTRGESAMHGGGLYRIPSRPATRAPRTVAALARAISCL
ncbi:hypothetical protein [Sorangium sp. So ce1078]|uniref:hypothetical protein n=1 Tax=Sorangium sp. So ce1078 TaxID=3133329 RepID=UPI003F6092DC